MIVNKMFIVFDMVVMSDNWEWVKRLCEKMFSMYGKGMCIPTDMTEDPCRVIDTLELEENCFRLIPFVLWLTNFPEAPSLFHVIHREHRCLMETAVDKLHDAYMKRVKSIASHA